jgi:hypothetical protein
MFRHLARSLAGLGPSARERALPHRHSGAAGNVVSGRGLLLMQPNEELRVSKRGHPQIPPSRIRES